MQNDKCPLCYFFATRISSAQSLSLLQYSQQITETYYDTD